MPQDLCETDLRLAEVTLHYATPRQLDFDEILGVIDDALDQPGRAFHMNLTEDGTSAVYSSGRLVVAITCQDHPLPAPKTPPRILGRSDPHGLPERLANHTAFVRMALEDPVDPDIMRPTAPEISLPLRVARALSRYLVQMTQPEMLHWGSSDLMLAPEDFLDLSQDATALHLYCATRPGPAKGLFWLSGSEHILGTRLILCDPGRDEAALEQAALLFVDHCLSLGHLPERGARFEFDDGAPLDLMVLDQGPYATEPSLALAAPDGIATVVATCDLTDLAPARRRGLALPRGSGDWVRRAAANLASARLSF